MILDAVEDYNIDLNNLYGWDKISDIYGKKMQNKKNIFNFRRLRKNKFAENYIGNFKAYLHLYYI